ncbi:MAG: septum formation protein Maf [Candidatus Omnitrophica bacterium CG23_combo_of_CG06-09_8_20_14_all_41_10]|uniref:Nucleoside triphosphate pyrophosphatase n=1 Tax=Candidatus Sherwoodlollariibacterium unditelluris TaxID=1974757 RepID=A0A2G9YL25_9BACT|nr:MAG: septum formation protein Maf [Candidatus Omnitrophica bacterium CG23_combo_of_CG06-09_8_20_14_all_41_10]
MTQIYLASKSKARRKLLQGLGLKFKVIPTGVKEIRVVKGISFARLVKMNALNKAIAAAEKIKSGVVIGADTICVQDGRIFGKPRDLKDAKVMLKRLSTKPQWLYTGIAVVDKPPHQLSKKNEGKINWCGGKDKQRIMLDYERTKVYMDKLTDKEIDRYFVKLSPLGMAGSFDIQGKGAIFIRRIEGCFYNVVGLPIRKLYLMLKKLNIKIFAFILFYCSIVLLSSGCSTEYNIVTGEQEVFYYSTDKEVAMGQAIAKEVEKEYKQVGDPLIQKRVEDIGKKIAAVSDRKEIDYHFMVLDDDEVNAFSLPGGYVYVNKGLVDKVESDDELAAVLGHEIGHIVARHSIKKLQALQGYSILRLLVAVAPSSGEIGNAADIAFAELLLGYSREDELLADQLGARYIKLAGYDPHGMITFLKKLQEINRRKPLQPKSYFKTHPYVPDRIRAVKQELGERVNFDDYINIEQNTHK